MPAINRKPLTVKILRELAKRQLEKHPPKIKKDKELVTEIVSKLQWKLFVRDENIDTTQMDYKPLETPKRLNTIGVHQSVKMKNANEPRSMYMVGKDMLLPVQNQERIDRTIANHNKRLQKKEIMTFEDKIVEVQSFNHGKTIRLVRV